MIRDKDSFVFTYALADLDSFQELGQSLTSFEPKMLVNTVFKELLPKIIQENFDNQTGFPPKDFKEAFWASQVWSMEGDFIGLGFFLSSC